MAQVAKHAVAHETARKELPQLMSMLGSSVKQALMMTGGSKDIYIEVLGQALIERGQGPASKLGRLRRKLATERKS